jgi:hypothetical protein
LGFGAKIYPHTQMYVFARTRERLYVYACALSPARLRPPALSLTHAQKKLEFLPLCARASKSTPKNSQQPRDLHFKLVTTKNSNFCPQSITSLTPKNTDTRHDTPQFQTEEKRQNKNGMRAHAHPD